jgi:TIR domain/STAS domain
MADLLKVHLGGDRIIFWAPKHMALGESICSLFGDPIILNRVKNVVFDLSMCGYIDSTGIGLLMTVYTTCILNGGEFILNNVPPKVSELLKVIRLDSVLTYSDVDYSKLPFFEISPQDFITRIRDNSFTDFDVKKVFPALLSLKIFLCHASDDKPQVRDLYDQLQSDGFSPWLDEENLLPGQEWQQEIIKAVRESHIVIVSLTHKSLTKSGFVQKELSYALDVAEEQPKGSIYIIPLKLEQCEVPERLRHLQWVNLFEARGYERLLLALKRRYWDLINHRLPS